MYYRLGTATTLLRDYDEVTLTNKAFRGFTVRYFKTEDSIDCEYWQNGRKLSRDEMSQPFLSAMLQNENWEAELPKGQ